MPIHRTLTDDTGEVFEVVSQRWVWVITGLISVQLFGLAILLVLVITNRGRISEIDTRNEIQRQRNLAMDEMLVNRARVQRWTYERICEMEKAHGRSCLDNPQWWADRNKYPALANDPDAQGSGLFPREKE